MTKYLTFILVLLMAGTVGAVPDTVYLNAQLATGNCDGSSWANAWYGEHDAIDSVEAYIEANDTNIVVLMYGVFRGELSATFAGTATAPIAFMSGNNSDNTPTAGNVTWYGGERIDTLTWVLRDGESYIYQCAYTPTWTKHSDGNDTYPWYVGEDGLALYPATSIDTLHYAASDSLEGEARTWRAWGQFYFDDGVDSLYVACSDSANPNTHVIEAAACHILDVRGWDHTRIWGINFYAGSHAHIFMDYDIGFPDSMTIDSCSFSGASGGATSNTACIRIMSGGTVADSSNNIKWVYVRKCKFRDIVHRGLLQHASAIEAYQNSFCVADSCVFDSCFIGAHWKTNLAGSPSIYNVVKHCTFNGGTLGRQYPSDAFVVVGQWGLGDSVYHNAIKNAADAGVYITNTNTTGIGGYFIANNTFYGCGRAVVTGAEATAPNDSMSYCKYNVIYTTSDSHEQFVMNPNDTLNMWTIDSNMYYPQSYEDFRIQGVGGRTDQTLAEWQTNYSFDLQSTGNTDPALDSVTADDLWLGFARSGASGEMNVTYGGKTWTVFGAVQPSASVDTVTTAIGDFEISGDVEF